MAKAAKKSESVGGQIELIRLEDRVLEIPIRGLTPLIPHKWSEKAKRMMPGHPEGDAAKKTKGKHDPEKEAEDCLYKIGKALAMPATAFKAAMVGACRFFDQPSMVEAKQLIFVEGDGLDQLVAISGEKQLREDLPRNANGNADLRYRYAILGWTTTLRVRFCSTRITSDSIVALVDAGGRGGVGDWRPSAPKSMTGTYGTWRVDDKLEVKEVSGGQK